MDNSAQALSEEAYVQQRDVYRLDGRTQQTTKQPKTLSTQEEHKQNTLRSYNKYNNKHQCQLNNV